MNRRIKIKAAPSILGHVEPGIIYHYTSLQALLNIVRKDCMVMWGTNYLYLNDKREIKEGLDVIKDSYTIDESFFNNLFILALSRTADNLTMWQSYSDNYSGCIIGIKQSMIDRSIVCEYVKEEAIKSYKMFSDLIDKKNNIHDVNLSSNNDVPYNEAQSLYAKISLYITSIIGIKHESFKYEDEIRIFEILGDNANQYIKYRSRNGLIIPYIEFELLKEALSEIWLPNDDYTELNKKSLETMLRSYGYHDVEIKVSETPFRKI